MVTDSVGGLRFLHYQSSVLLWCLAKRLQRRSDEGDEGRGEEERGEGDGDRAGGHLVSLWRAVWPLLAIIGLLRD